MKETLCWSCKNATGGCPWAHDQKEVDGWKAKPTITEVMHGEPVHSYAIRECPLYSEDYRRVTLNQLIKIAGWGTTARRYLPEIAFKKFKEILTEKGYDLLVYTEGRVSPEFYIKSITVEEEREL